MIGLNTLIRLSIASTILAVELTTSWAIEVDWNYDDQAAWPALAGSSCGGMRQSPIDIVTESSEESNDLIPLVFNVAWEEEMDGYLINTGRTIEFEPSDPRATLVTMRRTYYFSQFHFHWGSTDNAGSEHEINGEQRSVEIHFVHTTRGTCENVENSLSVLAVFAQVTDEEPTGFWKTLIDNFPTECGAEREIAGVKLSDFLPDVRDYYRYEGSLTTPLCDEIVQWFVLKDAIDIPRSVIEAFRTAEQDEQGTPLASNFRDVQDLNDREILSHCK